MSKEILLALAFSLAYFMCQSQTDSLHPNILLVIADDVGLDVLQDFGGTGLTPNTPTLDSLAQAGLSFDNAWSAPLCTPTRAAIMSGKYGVKTGVTMVPGHLDLSHTSLFDAITAETSGLYSSALFGKWHISDPSDPSHPQAHGLDHYSGIISGGVQDYYSWPRSENGLSMGTDTTYITEAITDDAITWANDQNQPWMLWMAHVAPHSPFHVPPSHLYSIPATETPYRKYIAMLESFDHELGRLIASLDEEVRENTLVIFIGDNGTPGMLLQGYPTGHGKGSLYEGGIHVPMIIAGAGVSRTNEHEFGLVHVVDIHATVLESVGADLPGGIYNSYSLNHLLTNSGGLTSDYNYSEIGGDTLSGFTIRNSTFKLIQYDDGSQEMYNLLTDSLETNDLMEGGLPLPLNAVKEDLEAEAEQRRSGWSCRDHIQNGNEEEIDCGGSLCAPCLTSLNDSYTLEQLMAISYNSAAQEISIDLDVPLEDNIIVEVYTGAGQLQKRLSIPRQSSTLRMDTRAMAQGTYLVRIIAPQHTLAKRLVVY